MDDLSIINASTLLTTTVKEFGAAFKRSAVVNTPDQFNVPYRIKETFSGKPIWGVRLDAGALPDATTKLITIPNAVLQTWGPVSERWLDLNGCFAYITSSQQSIPIPWVSGYSKNTSLFQEGFTESIILTLSNQGVAIRTESNRTNLIGVVTVKYTRADGR